MNLKMLHQLLWIYFIAILKITSTYVIEPNYKECNETICLEIGEILKTSIDFDVEPCDDFFKYACGNNFSSGISAPDFGEPFYSEPESQDLSDLRKILDEPFASENIGIDSLMYERQIYERCRKSGSHNQQEKTAYAQFLEAYKANRLNPQQYYDPNKNEHWTFTDLKYAIKGFGFAFFDIDIVERVINQKTRRYIQISPTSDNVLELNDLLTRKYMSRSERSGYSGYSSSYNVESKYVDLKNFISDFNQIVPYNKYDANNKPESKRISEWQQKYNQHARDQFCEIDWIVLLNELFGAINQKIGASEPIIVTDENYFIRLAEVLSTTRNMNTIINYIHLRFVSKTIGLVEKEYQDRYSMIPLIKGLICTPGFLVGTAHVYTQKYFSTAIRQTVAEIFDKVKQIIQNQLGSDKYYHQATSDVTKTFLRQLASSNVTIGYPKWLSDKNIVSNFYDSTFTVSDLYFSNQVRCIEILLQNKLRSYKDYWRPIFDIKVFFKSFMQEKIEFSKDLKRIVIPARVFNENSYKFVSDLLPNSVNYGAAGTVLASELYYLWLRRAVYAQNATSCITSQIPTYTNTEMWEEHLLRATSYLLGLHNAFEAWPNPGSYPIEFPNFGAITDYRLFFLSFAESICRTQVRRNEMPPYQFINFVVSNLVEFREAFQCYDRHVLNRKHKCNPLENETQNT